MSDQSTSKRTTLPDPDHTLQAHESLVGDLVEYEVVQTTIDGKTGDTVKMRFSNVECSQNDCAMKDHVIFQRVSSGTAYLSLKEILQNNSLPLRLATSISNGYDGRTYQVAVTEE